MNAEWEIKKQPKVIFDSEAKIWRTSITAKCLGYALYAYASCDGNSYQEAIDGIYKKLELAIQEKMKEYKVKRTPEEAKAACIAAGEDPFHYIDYADLRNGKQNWEYFR